MSGVIGTKPQDSRIPISVVVATHKPYRMPSDPMYVPIHVGAELHPDVLPEMLGDDTGDNISDRNGYYSELTGLYWLWKNRQSEYKGLTHYRRHFATGSISRIFNRDRFDSIVGQSEVMDLLAERDIIVARKRSYYIESVYSHYAHTFHAEQFDVCRDVLSDMRPAYLPAWDHLMEAKSAHIFNMFIMSSSKFDAYCDYMFPVLFELEHRLDPGKYDSFNARYIGRVSERLLDPWLETNGYGYTELPVLNTEPVDWAKKGTSFLMAKFGMKKYGKSF
ncbi:DUF4422 domain-containing protein [Bifidobacterium crudilactis]|jgi:hypothetical protein|uniref:DUF4422 domain-containing protein n=1 Tax=Bifidobacterium crudilactis TaxID=327277 RepID=UPI00235681F9|nr:DUF4422 domain-containing protein [Bifidobacterium crudilactis]MCI1217120.1 DUF4422 domain-containing protein [Bifidobacterium crudilactis]